MSKATPMPSGRRVTHYAAQNGVTDGGNVRLTPAQERRNRQKNRKRLPGGKVHHRWTRTFGQEPQRAEIR